MFKKINKAKLGVAALILGVSGPAFSAWPNDQTIELVVGFAPGGSTDLMARAMAPFMEKRLGGQAKIVVVNKPGASGEIAATHIARAKPDGYTIGFVNVPGFVFIPMYKKSTYEVEDLRLIARVVDDPTILLARKEAKATTLAAIIQELKQKPGSLSFATSGSGTNGHMAMLQLEEQAKVTGNHIPYKGAAEVRTAVVGGQTDYGWISVAEYKGMGDNMARVVPIVLTSEQRNNLAKDVPTAGELGFKVLMSSERGIAAPKALPNDIANRMQKAIEDTLKDPAFLERVKNDEPVIAYLPGAAWSKSLLSNMELLRPFVSKMKQ